MTNKNKNKHFCEKDILFGLKAADILAIVGTSFATALLLSAFIFVLSKIF